MSSGIFRRYYIAPPAPQGKHLYVLTKYVLSGNLEKTLDALTLSSNAGVRVAATSTPTLGALTLASNAAVRVAATFDKTLDALTSGANADLIIDCDLAQTLGVLTLSANGVGPPSRFRGSKVDGHSSTSTTITSSLADVKDENNNNITLAENDYVVVVVVSADSQSRAAAMTARMVTDGGYDEFFTPVEGDDLAFVTLGVYGKHMGATPDTTVPLPACRNASMSISAIIMVFEDIDLGTQLDVTPTTAFGSNTGVADPPSITPSTAGAVILGVGAAAAGTGAVMTNPGDWSTATNRFRSNIQLNTADAIATLGMKEDWVSGAFNPAAFGGSTSGGSDSWAAATIALRPTGPISGTLSATLGALTSAANGAVHVAATSTPTLGVLTLAANAAVRVAAIVTPTLGDLTLSSLGGASPVLADVNVTLGVATLAANSTLLTHGSLASTLGALTTTSNADVVIQGTLGTTLGALTLGSDGGMVVFIPTRPLFDSSIGAPILTTNTMMIYRGEFYIKEGAPVKATVDATLGSLVLSSIGLEKAFGSVTATLGALTLASNSVMAQQPLAITAGISANANNSAVTPNNPAHASDDTLLCVAFVRGTATLAVSGAGWVNADGVTNPINMNGNNCYLFQNECDSAAEADPTITPSGGSTGMTVHAVVLRIRNRSFSSLFNVGAVGNSTGNTNSIPFPANSPIIEPGNAVLAHGMVFDDFNTGQASPLSGHTAGVTFTELVDKESTQGNDVGWTLQWALNSGGSNYTTGTGAASTGMTFAIASAGSAVYIEVER